MTDKSEFTAAETELLDILSGIKFMLFLIIFLLALIAGNSFAH